MPLCEIRVPTYQRPQLLERALRSLLAQTHRHWRALVLDDSPAQEGRSVVASLADDRITYRPNPARLGGAGNIDQAFASGPLLGGAYACVVEDDNWLLPDFLAANIAALEASGTDLLLRNQEIWAHADSLDPATATPTGRTTRGEWFQPRVYTPLELHAHLFFLETISNGGLFWRTSLKSSLQVGPLVTDAGLQEYCRCLQIQDPLLFAPEPLACWAEMPPGHTLRNPASNRTFGRGTQSLKRHLIARYGDRIIQETQGIASRLGRGAEMKRALADVLRWVSHNKGLTLQGKLKSALKAAAKLLFVKDPLKEYLGRAGSPETGAVQK